MFRQHIIEWQKEARPGSWKMNACNTAPTDDRMSNK